MSEVPSPSGTEPRWLRVIDVIARVSAVAGGVALLAMCVNVVADVVMRNVANSPLPGTLDYVAYLWMPAAAVFGLGIAQARDEHIRVTLLIDHATPATRRWTLVAGDIVTGLVVGWMAYLAFDAMTESVGVLASSTLGNPVWPARIAVFAAFVVFELCIVARIARLLRHQLPPTEIESMSTLESADVR